VRAVKSLLSRRWLSWSSYGIAFLVWSLVAAFLIAQRYLFSLTAGVPFHPLPVASGILASCWVWALLSPFILQFAQSLPLDRTDGLRNLGLHALLAVGCLFVDTLADAGAALWFSPGNKLSLVSRLLNRSFINLFSYAVVLATGHALNYYGLLSERKNRATELEKQLLKAQLRALQMQLRPHFLFNSLHTVAGLIRTGQGQTAIRLIAELGHLLRSVLKGDGEQLVPLRVEIDFIQRYLEIERIRFAERLRTRISVAPEAMDAMVPSLILQPLVENALRHGIESRAGIGEVEVEVTRDRDTSCIWVRDSSLGAPSDDAAFEGAGIGLANTRERLRHLYGESHRFELARTETGGAVAVLTIPFQEAKQEERAA